MSVKCKEIINRMNIFAEEKLAEEWDNCGLLIGDSEAQINKVLVALDAIPEVIDEAIEKNVDLIITHHPFIFKPIKLITNNTPLGKSIYKLIQNNIGVYSAHTNLDIAYGGTNDTLAQILELENISVLEKIYFSEEEKYGMGRIGTTKKPLTLEEYALFVKDKLNLSSLRIVGEQKKLIKKVAITTGSGMSYLKSAIINKADLFITGDIKFHEAQEALNMGICLLDAGHYATEIIIVDVILEYLESIQDENFQFNTIVSKINGEPFITL